MKATILFTSIAAIVGSILFISKPTNAVGSGVTQPQKTLTTGSYSTKFIVECPVASLQPKEEPKYDYIATDGAMRYEHCKECETGVFMESTEGTIRCTFCEKVKI